MYQLSKDNSKNINESLLVGQHDIIVHNNHRNCTDILCLILFILLTGAFIGILIYSLIEGDPKRVFNVYNADGVQCYQTQSYKYGFLPSQTSASNATCVSQCPNSNKMTVSCLPDQSQCTQVVGDVGAITASYTTTPFGYFCLPSINIANQDITQNLNTNILRIWNMDLAVGWQILVGAALFSMVASMAFLCFVRCCTGLVIWITISVCILGSFLIGILFILQAKGINISSYIPQNSISTASYNSLIIIGSGLIIFGFLLALITICLKDRISVGSKAVELGSYFLLQNCCIILLPILQSVLIAGGLAAIIVGSIYLYSLGSFTFPNNYAFPIVQLNTQTTILLIIYLVGGFWLVFFFHGCNHFIICSAVSIWFFNYESHFDIGAPFSDSLVRLVRYHPGSVAITSLVNSVFYIVKIIAHIFSFQAKKDDHGLTLVCLKFLSCIFCIFKCFLRFLNDATYVQIAVTGRSYCPSAVKAFSLITDHIAVISISDGISIFFTILGISGIGVGTSIAAYFVCANIQYFAKLLTSPVIVTVVSGLIAFVVSGIYLSMIDLSAQSILQCYYIDHQFNKGNTKYTRSQFKEIIMIEP